MAPQMLTRLKPIKFLLHRHITGFRQKIKLLLKSLIQPMTTYDSVSFDLRLASGTIMNVLIVLIVRHPVQLTIVSHIRKYDLYCS